MASVGPDALERLIPETSNSEDESEENNDSAVHEQSSDGACRVRFAFVEVVLFLFCFATAITWPAIQFYVIEVIDDRFYNISVNSTKFSACSIRTLQNVTDEIINVENEAESTKAKWNMYLSVTTSMVSILPTLFFGSLSDQYGRKPFMVIFLVGGITRNIVALAVIHYNLPIWGLLFGSVFEGLGGSFGIAFLTLFSYIADTTTAGKQRAFRIVAAEAAAAIGIASGQFIAGYWIEKQTRFALPVLVGIFTNGAALFYTLISIRETSKPKPFWKVMIRDCFKFVRVYTTRAPHRWILWVCLACIGLASLHTSAPILLFLQNTPFCWGALKITTFIGFAILLSWPLSIAAVKAFQTLFGLEEFAIALIGSLSNIGSNALMGIAKTDSLVYTAPVVGCLGNLIIPMIRSVMSRQVPLEQQGSMFAGVACVQTLVSLVGSIICNEIYAASLGIHSGLVFLVIAFCVVIVAALLIYLNYAFLRTKSGPQISSIQ